MRPPPRTDPAPVTGWPAEFAARYRALRYWRDETFGAFLATRADRHATRTAVVGPSLHTGRWTRLTYAELDRAAGAVHARLRAAGVRPRDRVLLQLPNCVEYATYLFGVLRSGAWPVFTLPGHREAELTDFCRIADAAAHILGGPGPRGADPRATAQRVAGRLRATGHVPPLVVDAGAALPEPATAPPPAETGAEEVAFLQLSGGTTGTPKLIPRTPADYLYSVRESARICGVGPETVMLVTLPAAHNFPMSSPGILGVLHAGGTVVMAPDPSPPTAFGLIESERVTMTSVVPPVLQAWLPAARRTGHDLGSLDVVQVGGARLADAVAARVGPDLGARLQQVFGMAEGLVNYTRLDEPDDLVTGTQGRPISPDDEIRVVDGDGRDVPPGTEGLLLTRGPYTIRGYYRAGAAGFTPDGFYRTGDLVRRLPSGHLVVTGRAKDQINRGGEKIAAEEVEGHLLAHPRLRDAAVVAMPDRFLGERVCAFVIPDGPPAPSAAELRRHLDERGIAGYKVPDRFEIVAEFPVSAVGKTSRRDLRRALTDLLRANTERSPR
ncbi:AMP-binding protein [Phytohabitans sp. ZYX-F-186]|uniref:Long-chain-fatty-acid--CoA ligase n=1 Tax=Phytohabitans maris TaxID=3071409 RepID=A0ABU0Z937_9ACTN|nr:AMP-binding protein [Phytohabitans sp. ZYX-F-186]MDQ7903571.1 AMP-binding protein [Phytohabitans sp. ZYX-F-186]